MAKKLSDVLAGTNKSKIRPGKTGDQPGVDYAGKMKDERDFVSMHDVEEFEDRAGNGDDVYKATNIKHQPDPLHGHIPKPKDEKQYKINNEEAEGDPRVQPKDVKKSGKKLSLIMDKKKIEENNDGSRTRTETEQARARFDKNMEKKKDKEEKEGMEK